MYVHSPVSFVILMETKNTECISVEIDLIMEVFEEKLEGKYQYQIQTINVEEQD